MNPHIPVLGVEALPAGVAHAEPVVRQGVLRMQMRGELTRIRDCIEESGLHDAMTQAITQWQQGFTHALRVEANEREACEAHIDRLLVILRDPLHECVIPQIAEHGEPPRDHPVVAHMIAWLKRHAPRKVFLMELEGINRSIVQSGLEDEMTQQARGWNEGFMRALNGNADPRQSGQINITLLQELLRDAITDAPLDEGAVLGSDGHTYSRMSLDVYLLSVPVIYRNRCPLDVNNPAPFTVVPHVVAKHLARFLKGYHALQESIELRRTFERLMAQAAAAAAAPPAAARLARMNRIFGRAAAVNRNQAAALRNQRRELDQQLEERLEGFAAEMNQVVNPLVRQVEHLNIHAHQQLDEIARRDEAGARAIDNQLDRAAENQNQAMEEAAARLERVVVDVRAQWQAARQDLDHAVAENQEALVGIEQHMQEGLQRALIPIAQQINAYAQAAPREIARIAAQDRAAVDQVEAMIQQLDREIEQLDQENLALQHAQEDVGGRLTAVQREEIMLRQAIIATEKAIKDAKKKRKKKLLQTVVIVGVSVFVTWGLSSVIAAAGSAGGAAAGGASSGYAMMLPKNGGAMLSGGFAW